MRERDRKSHELGGKVCFKQKGFIIFKSYISEIPPSQGELRHAFKKHVQTRPNRYHLENPSVTGALGSGLAFAINRSIVVGIGKSERE